MAGNFHSDELHLVERYTMLDADAIGYEVTIEDPQVFTRPWTISMTFHRQTEADRIFEYQCQAEAEEANGAFERDAKTWYPGLSSSQIPAEWKDIQTPFKAPTPKGEIKRMATASRICRVTSCRMAAAATTDSASTNRTS